MFCCHFFWWPLGIMCLLFLEVCDVVCLIYLVNCILLQVISVLLPPILILIFVWRNHEFSNWEINFAFNILFCLSLWSILVFIDNNLFLKFLCLPNVTDFIGIFTYLYDLILCLSLRQLSDYLVNSNLLQKLLFLRSCRHARSYSHYALPGGWWWFLPTQILE